LNDIVGVSGALSANEAAYQAYIDANGGNFSTPATAAEVQAMVTSVNVTQTLLANIGTDEDDGAATTTNATAAQLNDIVGVSGALAANESAYQAYIDANGGNFSTPATAAEVQAMVTSVNDAVTLLAAIGADEDDGAATTTNATASQLNDIVGVSGALAANEAAYQAYIDANGGNFSTPATAAEVQAMVTSVNDAVTLLAAIGTDEDDGAATTTNATVAQLNNIVGVSGALAANESAYQAYIDANGGNFSTPATAAEVQAMVTSVNVTQTLLANIGTDEDDGAATTTNATAAQLNDIVGVSGALAANESAYQAYIDANGGNFSTPATAAEVQAMVTSVNDAVTLLAAIGADEDDGAATTTNATASQLNDIVGVSGALAANEAAYQAYIDANGGNFSTPATAAEVQAMVTSVNDAVTLLAAIGTDEDDGAATTTNATVAQLNNIVGVSGALAANESAYQAYIDANGGNFSTPATAAEVQAMVTSVNVTQTLLANIGTDEDDGAATTTNATAAQLNDIVGVSGALAANESAYQAYIDANGGNFSTPATAAEVQAMVTSVNDAVTLLAAIGTDEDDGAATTTNATASQLNDIVGVSGALAANESAYQAYIDANGGNFSTPATAAEVQAMVTSVNDAVTLLAAIGTDEDDGAATTTNATAAQLNDIVGVSGALAANESAYQAYIDANGGNFSTPATAAEVQAMVTSVNNAVTLLAAIGADEDDGAATTTNATASQLNDIVGVSGALAANESAYQAYIDANGGNFSTPATAAEVQAMVNAVNTAITTISTAAQNNSATATTPTLADYAIADVSNVNASNLAAVNDALNSAAVTGALTDTSAEIQSVVDGYRAILASADGTDGNGTNPTQGQYAAIGVTGVDDTEEVKLLGDVIDGLSSTAVDQVSEVQALADAVQSVMDGAAGTASKPTLAELQALGINNVTADNIDKVQALFRTAAVDRAAVNSVDKIQALVNTIEDPPVNTVPGSQTVNEDTLLSISGISVADPEGNLATTQLSVTNGTLTVSVASSVLITEGALGGSTLTLTGNQNEINAALATLTYTGNANFNGSDTLTVLSTDSSSIPLSDRDTVAITVSPVADNPINTVPAAQTVNEDTLLSISGISVADPEGNVASTQLSVTSGTLTVSMAGGGTISAGANGSSTLTLSGNQTEINAALTTLTYTGNANFNGSDTLTVLSTDSSSIPLTDSDTVSITVSSVDDEPTLTATGDNSVFTEGGSAVSIFSNSDVDPVEPGQTFNRIVLTITNVGTGSNEYLTIIGTTFELVTAELRGLGSYGVEFDSLDRTVNNSDGTSTVILTHAAVHPGELEFVLNTMAYHTDGNDPTANGANRVITVTSLQDTGSNTAPSDNIAALNVQSTITVTPVNDEPTLTATSDNSVFTEGGSAVSVFSNSVVDPVESGQTFNRIVLTITNVGTGSNEYLTIFGDPLELVAASGLANKNFFGVALDSLDYVVTNSSGTTTITLTHSSVTTTELKDMLDGMTYHSSSDDPGANGANRVITVTSLRDTGSNTAPSDNIAALNVQSTITVTPVNDAPIVNNFNGDSFTYNENTGAQLIDQSTAATVTDADSANFDGGNLTVTIASGEDAAEDLLSVNTANVTLADSIAGSNVTVGGQVIGTLANAISEGNDFVVNFNVNATTARIQTLVQSVTYQNTDTTNPTGGDRTVRVTVTDGDGGTATSTSADVTITVNPAPKIDLDGSESGVGYTSSGISQANVESAAGVSIIDADGTVVDDSVSGGFSSLTIKANDTDINDQLIIDGTVDRTIALDTSSDLNNQAVTVGAVAYRLDYVAATDTLTITRADAGTITTTQARAFLDATNYRNDGTFDNKSRTFNITGTDTLGLVSALAITTIETLAPTTTQISHTVVATEDVAFDFAASNFVSDGSNLERIRIDSLSLNGGALFIDTDNNGVRDGVEEELLVGDEVSVTDITASRFSYSSAAHSDVDGDSFTFSAQNTGLGFSSSATSTINVNPAVDGVNLATTLAVSPSTTGGPTFGDFVFTAGTDTDDGDIGSFAATTSQFIVGGTDDDSLIGGQGNDFLFGDGSGEYFIIPVPQVSDLIDGDGTESISSIAVRNIPYGMLLSDGVVGGNTSAIGDTRVDITGWSTSNIQLLIFESSLANSDASVTDDISIVLDVVTVETATADTAAAPGTNTRLNSQTISIDLTPSTVTPGHDSIEGNGGNDTLVGNLGYDTLDGGAGNDTFYDTPLNFLNGSDGDDVFIISRQRNINNEYSDITLDFRSNTSTLDSDRSLSNSYYIEGDSGIDRVQIAEHGTILYFATGKNLDAEILDYNGFTDVTVEITTPANFSLASATAISFSDGIINGVGGTEGRIIFRLAYSDVVPGGASVLSSLFDQTIILEGNTSRGASTTGRQIIRAQNGVTDDIWYAAPGVYLLGGEVASGNPTNGNDQFIWGRGAADTGDTQMVATELVGFNRVNASADGLDAEELDTLDLRDLLVGEYFSGDATNVTDLGNLADYIWVGTGTGTTRDFIKIDVDGGGNPETDFDLAINLLRPTDVNVIRGTGDANSRIQTLIENGILLVDNQGAETAAPTSGHDILTGSVTADSIAGEAGNDTLSGLAGNDYLHGWTGNDTIYGGTNASAIGVGTVTGIASGSDANTGSGDDEIYGGAGTDVLYGQDGDDIIKGDQQVHYNILETNDAEGAVGSNSVDGVADSDDIIRGGSGSDTIYGNGGDDLLVWGIGDYGTAGAAGRDVDTVMDFRRFDATEDNRDGLDVLNLSDLLIGENQTTVTVDGVALDIGNLTKYLYIEKNDAEVKIYVDHDGSGELTSSNFDANTDLLIVLKTSPDSVVGTSSTQASMINFLIENGLVVTDVV
jgi:Ca2+-binding RTX toxin-like protein